MPKAILFTQCLQKDFVELLEKYDPLPNALHVGYEEAKRLLGERPDEGPVAAVMGWAYGTPEKDLAIIHIRDWHDPEDNSQKDHLEQFSGHCIKDTIGAEFVFQQAIVKNRGHQIINASGLNDFECTGLGEILDDYKGKPVRAGIMGVWTEAKIFFLCYELKTRYPDFDIALCSALTASSSRAMHFIALDQIKNVLGIKIFSSVGAFTEFLTGTMPGIINEKHSRLNPSRLRVEDDYKLDGTDSRLVLYLYRDCKEVSARAIDGGYSGNLVLKTNSRDILGHIQVPSVVKAGDRDLIAKERIAFEKIQEVLGNNAPAIVDFAEMGHRGAIKYRYAAMTEGNVRTFQDFYQEAEQEEVNRVLDRVYTKQLGKLYEAAVFEKLNLLEYYEFSPKYAQGVKKRIEKILGRAIDDEERTELFKGHDISNVYRFYNRDLLSINEYGSISHYMAYVHGDLNGRNIIIDDHNNVWLIDFFHTHKGHILRDLIKLENDILYIWTAIDDEDQLEEACRLSRMLIEVEDLGSLPDFSKNFRHPQFGKALMTIARLRSYYPRLVQTDRDPYQLHVGLLRYAVHNLSFDESSNLQKKWALYSASVCSEKVKSYILKSRILRIDYIDLPGKCTGFKLGLTILPGRKDKGRILRDDIEKIRQDGIKNILCLITKDEFDKFGVPDLKKYYKEAGFETYYLPVIDQGVPSKEAVLKALEWLDTGLKNGKPALIHCVGGLGRSGTLAACYITKYCGRDPKESVQIVRDSRSERAIESKEQIEFIYNLC